MKISTILVGITIGLLVLTQSAVAIPEVIVDPSDYMEAKAMSVNLDSSMATLYSSVTGVVWIIEPPDPYESD